MYLYFYTRSKIHLDMPSFLVRKVLLCKAAGRKHIQLTIKQRLYLLPRSSWLKCWFGYSKLEKEILNY